LRLFLLFVVVFVCGIILEGGFLRRWSHSRYGGRNCNGGRSIVVDSGVWLLLFLFLLVVVVGSRAVDWFASSRQDSRWAGRRFL
jgi:hypothetical protein